MHQINATISGGGGGGGNSGIVTGSVTVQLQNVFKLISQLQDIASSGNTASVGSVLQTILAQLKSLQTQAPSSITSLIATITSKITTLQQQVQTGSFDISLIMNFIEVI